MAFKDPDTLQDGYLSFEGGIDSGFPASLIQLNEAAWAVNATMRGGFLTPRPGIRKRIMRFTSEEVLTNFKTGRFQGAGTYLTTDANTGAPITYLATSVGGRIFLTNLNNNYLTQDISITGDINQADVRHAWFQQAENWLIVQNRSDAPFLYNGSVSRRAAGQGEVPLGGPMAYGKGRLWVARDNLYFGGDLVNTKTDAVIKFTENDYLNEGGAFAVANGNITGMAFAANLDTSLGDGDLLVFNTTSAYAFDAPVDRTTWKNLQYPIQRFALLKYGSMNHEGIATVNGDLFFRAQDGVRSLKYARRDFEEWGNTPISRQATRALQYDTESRLSECSTVTFDNRMLMTVQPQKDTGHGTWHRGLVSLDFYLVSGMGRKLNPAWEGVWTGLRILRIITAQVNNVTRCFIYALNDSDEIELWEVSKQSRFDHDGTDDVPIHWAIESKSFAFKTPVDVKRLLSGDLWFDQLTGEFSMTARFRADLAECWTKWNTFADCAKYRDCDPVEAPDCQTPVPFRGQVRSRIGLGQPPDVEDPFSGNGFTRSGFDFQVRFDMVGYVRLKRLRLCAHREDEDIFGDLSKTGCVENTSPDCSTDACPTVACCDLDDYDYSI